MASNSGLEDKRLLISCANDHSVISQGTKNVETSGTTLDVRDQNGRSATKNTKSTLIASGDEQDYVPPMELLPKSTHHDGSIRRSTHAWKKNYAVHDRTKTRLADPKDCIFRNGKCKRHNPSRVLQFFSLKLAELTVHVGPIELYGYIAVRDCRDTLLNYVVNISRDDPVIVNQGSLINMAGPKRGIDLYCAVLVEFDIRIKAGKKERDDHQLIDGVSGIADLWGVWNQAFTNRIYGDCGAVDVTVARIDEAVIANVEVAVSEVQSSFELCFSCFIGGYNEEIRLFDGAVGECRLLKRSVVAVVDGSTLDLKFKVASEPSSSVEHWCSFKADTHGLDTREVKTELGLMSVKVAWSTLRSV
ncbi:uncharacterized protein LOC123409345 [Hordeum vulgare subsp. vulgare]|uniref:uncharacterized protein LOC123409345 n=1 Tax=Hordeum vulgare subsp. vulgare TaxID=112509 RepID=UPI001D1A41C3|nr:uncharacterized protein LOC123409345 [Hordeum vulgare subsp. vulgare]